MEQEWVARHDAFDPVRDSDQDRRER